MRAAERAPPPYASMRLLYILKAMARHDERYQHTAFSLPFAAAAVTSVAAARAAICAPLARAYTTPLFTPTLFTTVCRLPSFIVAAVCLLVARCVLRHMI